MYVIDKQTKVQYSSNVFFFYFEHFRPEAMGVVTGCIFLIALFLFIPVPFVFNEKRINEFPHNQVHDHTMTQ